MGQPQPLFKVGLPGAALEPRLAVDFPLLFLAVEDYGMGLHTAGACLLQHGRRWDASAKMSCNVLVQACSAKR